MNSCIATRSLNSRGKKFVIRMILLIVYGFLGAGILNVFEAREKRYSTISKAMLEQLKKNFTKRFNTTDNEFQWFTISVYEAIRIGHKPDWSYFKAAHFAYTAMTTIGYGNLTPITTSGKLFCVIFCLFGIPLCLLTLKTAGELISGSTTDLIVRVERKLRSQSAVNHVTLKCATCLFLLMVAYLSLCSAISVFWEKWTFADAFYAWFVTYTTVGFGDFVPFDDLSQRNHHDALIGAFHLFATFPAIFGLCIVASVIDSMVKVFENKDSCVSDSCCCANKGKIKEVRVDGITKSVLKASGVRNERKSPSNRSNSV